MKVNNEEKYITTNFEIIYPRYKKRILHPITELYLNNLYNEFKTLFVHLVIEQDVFSITDENIKRQKMGFSRDLLSYYVINNHTEDNPFFTYKPNYDIQHIKSLLGQDWYKIKKNRLKDILAIMEKECKKNYRKYNLQKEKLRNIPYDIIVGNDKYGTNIKIEVIPKVEIDNNIFHRYIIVKKAIYIHLVKMYNMTQFGDFEKIEPIDSQDFHEKVFLLYNRYFIFDSGNNQSSIIPSFKKILKKYLSIKIELFGSAINTSNRYGSIFHDIERYFGSLGDFFKLDIKKGYYEINPPYENTIINDMFFYLGKWLNISVKDKKPLLFFLILPKRSYQKFENFTYILPFVKKFENIPKEMFPFLRHDRLFLQSRKTPIVNVNIFILHNDYIEPITKSIVEKWNSYVKFNLHEEKM